MITTPLIFLSLVNPCTFLLEKEKTLKCNTMRWIITKSYRKNNVIPNKSKLAIYWYMMIFSLLLFWLKNCRFSTVVRIYYILNYVWWHYHFFYVSTDVIWKKCSSSYFSFLLFLCMLVWNKFPLQQRTFHCTFDF